MYISCMNNLRTCLLPYRVTPSRKFRKIQNLLRTSSTKRKHNFWRRYAEAAWCSSAPSTRWITKPSFQVDVTWHRFFTSHELQQSNYFTRCSVHARTWLHTNYLQREVWGSVLFFFLPLFVTFYVIAFMITSARKQYYLCCCCFWAVKKFLNWISSKKNICSDQHSC